MHRRKALGLVGVACLLVVLTVAPAGSGSPAVAVANGGIHWTIELPNPFGVEVGNRLAFTARGYADGSADGHFVYHQTVEGETFRFNVDVTCLQVYDGIRAKLGGVITFSNEPTLPPGVFGWFSVIDNGQGAMAQPDQSTILGFGNEAANEAFCSSPALPRFAWDVQGNAQVAG